MVLFGCCDLAVSHSMMRIWRGSSVRLTNCSRRQGTMRIANAIGRSDRRPPRITTRGMRRDNNISREQEIGRQNQDNGLEQKPGIFQLFIEMVPDIYKLLGTECPMYRGHTDPFFTCQAHLYLDANPAIGLMILMSNGAASNPSSWTVCPNAVK